MKPDSVVQ